MSTKSWTNIPKKKSTLKREEDVKREHEERHRRIEEEYRAERDKSIRLEEIGLAKKFIELHPQCCNIGQVDAVKRMRRYLKKKEDEIKEHFKSAIKEHYESIRWYDYYSGYNAEITWYDVIVDTEFDTNEAANIRAKNDWEEECAEYRREDAYNEQCKREKNEYDRDEAEFEKSIAEQIEGLPAKEAERLSERLRDVRRDDLDSYYDFHSCNAYNNWNNHRNNHADHKNLRERLLEEYRVLLRKEEEKKEMQKMIFNRRSDKGMSLASWVNTKAKKGVTVK
jgi:hypothetical protein